MKAFLKISKKFHMWFIALFLLSLIILIIIFNFKVRSSIPTIATVADKNKLEINSTFAYLINKETLINFNLNNHHFQTKIISYFINEQNNLELHLPSLHQNLIPATKIKINIILSEQKIWDILLS